MDQMWFCCEAKERLDKVCDDFEGILDDLLTSLSDGWMDDKAEQIKRATIFSDYMAMRIKKLSMLSEEISSELRCKNFEKVMKPHDS